MTELKHKPKKQRKHVCVKELAWFKLFLIPCKMLLQIS